MRSAKTDAALAATLSVRLIAEGAVITMRDPGGWGAIKLDLAGLKSERGHLDDVIRAIESGLSELPSLEALVASPPFRNA